MDKNEIIERLNRIIDMPSPYMDGVDGPENLHFQMGWQEAIERIRRLRNEIEAQNGASHERQ